MDDDREKFLNGVLAFGDALRALNMSTDDVLVQLSERDGRTLEHVLTRLPYLVASVGNDQRYSTAKADKTVREFQIAGIKFWYKVKPFLLPSGDIV